MHSRRRFLKSGLGAAGAVSLATTIPEFIPKALATEKHDSNDGRVLVVVELDGGNDGINTIVPFRDEGYQLHRKTLRLPSDSLIRVSDDIALHPSLGEFADFLGDGKLAVVQGVGYPNPSRSHFRSMEIWHSGLGADADSLGLGWLGKGLDETSRESSRSLCMSIGKQSVPLAVRGHRTQTSSVQRMEQFLLSPEHLASVRELSDSVAQDQPNDLLQFVQRMRTDAIDMALDFQSVKRESRRSSLYPASSLGEQLRLTAQLLKSDTSSRVFYTQQTGYDTHYDQLPQHSRLLGDLSNSVGAFMKDIEQAGLEDRVVVMMFSEFGRRVAENGSYGTDHGTAGPVFLAGANVAAGLHEQTPSLTDLDSGDLKASVDFRKVYATILEKWLQVESEPALGQVFDQLDIIAV